MQIETVADVVGWSAKYHQSFGSTLPASLARSGNDRLKLLGDYISHREQDLATKIAALSRTESEQSLGTWVTEFLNRQPLPTVQEEDAQWALLSEDQLLAVVVDLHEQLTDLYRHLHSRCAATPAAVTFEQLLEMEQHELAGLAQGANRLWDM